MKMKKTEKEVVCAERQYNLTDQTLNQGVGFNTLSDAPFGISVWLFILPSVAVLRCMEGRCHMRLEVILAAFSNMECTVYYLLSYTYEAHNV